MNYLGGMEWLWRCVTTDNPDVVHLTRSVQMNERRQVQEATPICRAVSPESVAVETLAAYETMGGLPPDLRPVNCDECRSLLRRQVAFSLWILDGELPENEPQERKP